MAAVLGAALKTTMVTKCSALVMVVARAKANPLPVVTAARQASAAPPLVTAPPMVATVNHHAAVPASRAAAGRPIVALW